MSILRALRSFSRSERGNIAMLSAFLIPPILGLTGMAIDLQYTFRQQNKVQHALDSAILAGALDRQAGATEQQATANIRLYADALIGEMTGNIDCGEIRIVFDPDGQDVEGKITCDQPTTLARLLGKDELRFHVDSTSTYGVGKVDISFIFDVSGSMNSNGRLGLLKSAAGEAFDTLLPDDTPRDGSVRIGITTYNHAVNAGSAFSAATDSVSLGPDGSDAIARSRYNSHNDKAMTDSTNGKRFFFYETVECERSFGCYYWSQFTVKAARQYYDQTQAQETCVYERFGANASTDIAPVGVNTVSAGNPRWNFNDSTRDKRNGANEVENGGANAYGNGAFEGRHATCQPSGPVALTEDKDVLKNHVNGLTANGGTAGHLGLAWGWYLISPNWSSVWPTVSEPWAYDEKDTTKVVILMTDGDFNTSHPDATKSSFRQAQDLCDGMKAEPSNVQVYTVGFQVPSGVTKTGDGQTILQYCASSAGHAFNASNGEELEAAYREIAQSISELRLKK